MECPEDGLGDGWRSVLDAHVTWSKSGSSCEGIQQFVIYNAINAIVCQSTYDVLMERL